jgi:hypothetical protein
LFYNADLLDILKGGRWKDGLSMGFIDDIVFGIRGLMAERNAELLKEMLEEAEEWRRRHGARFEKSKYQLIHFTRNKRLETTANITMANNVMIHPTSEAICLGVMFDKELRYTSHLQRLVKKGSKLTLALSRIAKFSWAAQVKYVRQLFTAVIVPRTDYAASIWHRPGNYNKAQTTKNGDENNPRMLQNNTHSGT